MRKRIPVCIFLFLTSCGQKKSISEEKPDTLSRKTDTVVIPESEQLLPDTTNCDFNNEVADLGIGLIVAPDKFEIYNDSMLTDKFVTGDMYAATGITGYCSKYYKPDYGIMNFVCLETTAAYYKILVNYSDVKFMPKTKKYVFMTWENYILQSYGIAPLAKQVLFFRKNEVKDTVAIVDQTKSLCPAKVEGDWVQVQYDCYTNGWPLKHDGEKCSDFVGKCVEPVNGWLRWRMGNRILISIAVLV